MNLADIIKSKAHATAYFFKQDWGRLSQSVEELSKYVIFEGSEAYIKVEKGMFAELQEKVSTTLVKYEVNISDDEGVGSIYIDYVNRRKPSMFHKTRKYDHSFNKYFDPITQQDLSDTQANEIKKRNERIKNELNNIDTFLNDQNDKFDTDLAKAKLDQLIQYQDKMSNNNQSRYKDLEKQQLKKEAEMKNIINKNQQDASQKQQFAEAFEHRKEIYKKLDDSILKSRAEAEKRFDEAVNDRDEKYHSTKADIEKVEQEVQKSRAKAEEEFNKAQAERKEYHTQTEKELGITHAKLLELRLQKDNNLKQGKRLVNPLY